MANTWGFSQETKETKPLSIELSLRHEKTGFNSSYFNYFWADGNFTHLAKTGNKTQIGAKVSVKANKRNTLFFGLGYNLYRTETNGNGLSMGFLDLELGHRFAVFELLNFNVHFENSLNFAVNKELRNHFIKATNLDFRTGLHLEKSITEKLNLFFGFNYGIGLNATPIITNKKVLLRSNMYGLKIGLRKEL